MKFEDVAPPGTSISDVGGEGALVSRMAGEMTVKLAENRGKRHWKDADIMYLEKRLLEETIELVEAVTNGGDVWAEAADVANFAAFIADNVTEERPLRA